MKAPLDGTIQNIPSPFLFGPRHGKLLPLTEGGVDHHAQTRSHEVAEAIKSLLGSKSYPCIPAQNAYVTEEYMVGIYQDLGCGSLATLNDLLYFRARQKESESLFMSFFAIYLGRAPVSEGAFETAMWEELSNLSAKDDATWDPAFSSDPLNKRFCFSLGGEAFFTVGMHPNSSRKSRRLAYPAIVFNLFEQFEELDRRGRYASTVNANRKLDMAYQGSLNPMVEKYADIWESIQFSGKENAPEWKCPFHRQPKDIK